MCSCKCCLVGEARRMWYSVISSHVAFFNLISDNSKTISYGGGVLCDNQLVASDILQILFSVDIELKDAGCYHNPPPPLPSQLLTVHYINLIHAFNHIATNVLFLLDLIVIGCIHISGCRQENDVPFLTLPLKLWLDHTSPDQFLSLK